MSPNQVIKNRRIELRLQETDVAHGAGLSVQEYGDIEQYPEEFATVTDLARAKRLCSALQLPITVVLGLSTTDSKEALSSRRAKTLTEIRISKGLTVEQLANDLGMEVWVIEKIESNESAIDQWPFEFVAKYADRLGLPISRFIA